MTKPAVLRLVSLSGVQPSSSANAAQVSWRSWRRSLSAACNSLRFHRRRRPDPAAGSRTSPTSTTEPTRKSSGAADPAQQRQGILTRHRLPLRGSHECTRADGVVRQPGVEVSRLLPQLVGEGAQRKPAVVTLGVESTDQRTAVERRKGAHDVDGMPGEAFRQLSSKPNARAMMSAENFAVRSRPQTSDLEQRSRAVLELAGFQAATRRITVCRAGLAHDPASGPCRCPVRLR